MYIHPGDLFVDRFGEVQGLDCIIRYANFLREEAGIDDSPPIDISKIYDRFRIPIPKRVPLMGQQGILVNADLGIIFIEDRDRETRQRFTEAHELMELLFATLPEHGQYVGNFKHHTKERLCNEGAAELIMPESSFLPHLIRSGISFKTARLLVADYDVSLSAALCQMVKVGPGHHAVILWVMKNKPTEIRNQISPNQLSFLKSPPERIAPKKLRVEWSFAGSDVPYIPPNKSVPEDSSIYSAWIEGNFTSGSDRLSLGSANGKFLCENLPFDHEEERRVLSLLHYPGDTGCQL